MTLSQWHVNMVMVMITQFENRKTIEATYCSLMSPANVCEHSLKWWIHLCMNCVTRLEGKQTINVIHVIHLQTVKEWWLNEWISTMSIWNKVQKKGTPIWLITLNRDVNKTDKEWGCNHKTTMTMFTWKSGGSFGCGWKPSFVHLVT